MTYVQIRNVQTKKSIDNFKMVSIPRVGETITLFYRDILNNQEKYVEEAVSKAKKLDGSSWVVQSVEYELIYGADEDSNWIWINVSRL